MSESVPPPPPPPPPPSPVESCVGCTFRTMKCRQINCPFYQIFVNQGTEFHRIMTVFNLDKVSEKLASIKHSSPDDVKANLEIYTEALKFHAAARHKHRYDGAFKIVLARKAENERIIDARVAEINVKRKQLLEAQQELDACQIEYETAVQGGLDTIQEDVGYDKPQDPQDYADEFIGIPSI